MQCIFFVALVALAVAEEPKEVREYKAVPAYAYAAPYGYGYAAAPYGYGFAASPFKFAAQAYAYPYGAGQQYAAYPYSAPQQYAAYPYSYGYGKYRISENINGGRPYKLISVEQLLAHTASSWTLLNSPLPIYLLLILMATLHTVMLDFLSLQRNRV